MSNVRPRRMDGYIRVSRVGARDVESESYITEAVQREKIEAWAALRGVEIVAWHVDRDQSGSKLSRPGFDAAMARIKAGDTEGIVVAAIDRLSRADVADALLIVRQIYDDHGGTLAAVDLGIDPTTEVGEMLLTVLLALARMQWRRYQAAWATSKERAIKRGVHVGWTPLGYTRREDGKLEPDPDTAPAVREAFRVAATQGPTAAVTVLREAVPARTWTRADARRILANRIYLGEVALAGLTTADAHEPLVDLATWTAANGKSKRAYVPGPRTDYALSLAVHCAACGTPMAGHANSKGQRFYRCGRNKTRPVRRGEGTPCPAPPVITAWMLEEHVKAELLRYVAEHRPDELADPAPLGDHEDVRRLESALRSAELARDQDAKDVRLRGLLGDAAFYERMEAHAAAVEQARAEFEEAATAAAVPFNPWPLVDEINAAPTEALPGLMERLGVRVEVTRGRGSLAERVRLVPATPDQPHNAA